MFIALKLEYVTDTVQILYTNFTEIKDSKGVIDIDIQYMNSEK